MISGSPRGTVTEMIETLLSRFVHETDPDARILLAACGGEVGGLDSLRLEETNAPLTGNSRNHNFEDWRLKNPPWLSSPVRYELELVGRLLVVSLRAASTSRDQNMIAYSIQQLLVLLDKSARESEETGGCLDSRGKPEMTSWLSTHLSQRGVAEVVSPFWHTEFAEAKDFVAKHPPFFENSPSYFAWLSNFCRFMVHRSNKKTQWGSMFFSCRTAVKTRAGLNVAEFLMPVFVLDLLCNGGTQDENFILQEFLNVLTFDSESPSRNLMSHTERQNAVNLVFSVIDMLKSWADAEAEKKFSTTNKSTPVKRTAGAERTCSEDVWPADESIMRIEDFLGHIPYAKLACAAAVVGMHARALLTLEMAARQTVSLSVFGSDEAVEEGAWKRTRSRASGSCVPSELSLMKEVLVTLNDHETVTALCDDEVRTDPLSSARDSIRQKEASADWEGAMQDYERAQQLAGQRDPALQRGALRCLLELGHFESVLNQVKGMVQHTCTNSSSVEVVTPVAIEAAWRLGRWDTLSELVKLTSQAEEDQETAFQTAVGNIFLGIRVKDANIVSSYLKKARAATMTRLSGLARESYSRSYGHIVRLQALREIEDASAVLCEGDVSRLSDHAAAFHWGRRLDFVSPAESASIVNVRLALARLSGDSTLEASLFIKTGKQARKSGLYNIAANCFAQAEAAILSIRDGHSAGLDMSSLRIQVAKLKHDCGRSNAALRVLGLENIETNIQLAGPELSAESALYVKNALGMDGEAPSNDAMNSLFAKRLLQSTRWMIDGGLKAGAEVVRRFDIIHKLAPKWEKGKSLHTSFMVQSKHAEFSQITKCIGFFQHAKFVHTMLESRANLLLQRLPVGHSIADEERLRCFMTDRICQRNVKLAMQSYSHALSLDTKHVYQALPRLLSLWFDLTSIGSQPGSSLQTLSLIIYRIVLTCLFFLSLELSEAQAWANRFMAEKFLDIPAEAFYTAIPQLISSVVHKNPETAKVVRGILARVLERFPAQAMWPLAWLRQSQHKERCKAGESIFRDAERILAQAKSSRYLLLVASKALFKFLQDLAKRNDCIKSNKIRLASTWEGEVELCEFIPPVQAALQVSLSIDKREIFPRQVPRMRAFDATVSVMTSKARPRKLVAYVVSNVEHVRVDPKGARAQRRRSMDIGELHFLLKQEAKGDLRKDARVQDLNNVINRLMSSANESKRSAQHGRRLHLRTFAVTCLSEDTGILEWVPQTAPFRTLVASCYNPLASELSRKRRGGHITNFTDPSLKKNFTAAQEAFLIEGDLKKATHLFEELSLKQCPPLFYWWFVHTFRDPASWYEARTAFTISTAVWSAVGHVIGLGDRHSENILIDTSSGACVHVDFDWYVHVA